MSVMSLPLSFYMMTVDNSPGMHCVHCTSPNESLNGKMVPSQLQNALPTRTIDERKLFHVPGSGMRNSETRGLCLVPLPTCSSLLPYTVISNFRSQNALSYSEF